ncbi:MAG: Gldg family protein, partial [Clostridia bacterium]|nr:Gldg family protein [Clostridia bacterium]
YSQDNIKAADIIVRTESDYSVLTAEDLFEGEYSYYSYGYTITASKAEQAITSAILNLTSEEKIKVEFILGYEEEDYTALKSLLEQNNYEVVETKILTSQLSEDAKISIIYGPLYDYDEQGINKLKEHMEKGKSIGRNIVYIASPDAGETPNLNNFLKDWGMSVGSGNVFETDVNNLFSNSVYYTICGYSQNEYTENLKNTSIPVAVPIAKPITMIEDAEVASNELLYFSETAGIIPMGAGNDWQPSESDICGPITASCISTKTEADVKSSVCVVSSTLAFDSGLLLRSSLNNSSYFINLFNSISENENNVIIESKSVEYDMLKINTTQALTIGVILAIIVPIALIVAGIFIWIRRKGR